MQVTELFQCPTCSLQSQHEELKKQHADLEEDHRKQGEEFSRTFSDHKERYLQLQQEKEQEISKLKGMRNLCLAAQIKMCICRCVLCDVRQEGIVCSHSQGTQASYAPYKLHFWWFSVASFWNWFICLLRVSI